MPRSKLPDMILTGSRIAGEVIAEILTNDPKLAAKLEKQLNAAGRKMGGTQFLMAAVSAAKLFQALNVNGINVMTTAEAEARMKVEQEVASPFTALGLTPSAPFEVVEAAYKALARKHHPDLNGGNDSRMKEINAAYAAIRRLFGK